MNIVQAEQVTQETMTLLEEKAKIQADYDRLFAEIRDRQTSLAELQAREKAFQESFVGNAEWLKHIKDLRVEYHNEQAIYDTVVENKKNVEKELADVRENLNGERVALSNVRHEKELMQTELEKVKTENRELKNEIDAVKNILNDKKNEVEQLKTQSSEFKETFAKKMQEIYGKEADLASKERNVRVYEERVIREYAILFPGVKMNT